MRISRRGRLRDGALAAALLVAAAGVGPRAAEQTESPAATVPSAQSTAQPGQPEAAPQDVAPAQRAKASPPVKGGADTPSRPASAPTPAAGDEPTVAPDPKESADNNVSFPADI